MHTAYVAKFHAQQDTIAAIPKQTMAVPNTTDRLTNGKSATKLITMRAIVENNPITEGKKDELTLLIPNATAFIGVNLYIISTTKVQNNSASRNLT